MKKSYSLIEYIFLGLKGFGMGIAEIIPGISGGTIAFIFGIYEELVAAIHSFDLNVLKDIFSGRFKEAINRIHFPFLIAVGIGSVIAILSMSKLLSWLLHEHPIQLHAFFFGLILASVPIIGGSVKQWNISKIILLLASSILTYFVVGMVPLETPNAPWFLFLSGMIAISAWILPGISGSFILLILGKYHFVLEAVNNRDFGSLIILASGIGFGIILFVRVIEWLFRKYHDVTLAFLIGLILGSLRKIWPWKETIETIITEKGKVIPIVQNNFFPEDFNGLNILAFLIMMMACFFPLVLHKKTTKA